VRRGIYAGAIGHFDYQATSTWRSRFRTLVYANGRAHWGVGGIVADSDPQGEWGETMRKEGRALWMAVQRAERGAR